MSYTQLEVVNEVLAVLGELPVNDITTPHPEVPAILQRLQNENYKLQVNQFWFNNETITLTPQVGNSRILLPNDTAAADLVDRTPRVTIRGRYLYNLDEGTYEFPSPVKVKLHRIVPFDDLPLSARGYVAATVKLRYCTDHDADPMKVRELKEERKEFFVQMNSEHIRNSQVNMLRRPGVALARFFMHGQSPFSGRNR